MLTLGYTIIGPSFELQMSDCFGCTLDRRRSQVELPLDKVIIVNLDLNTSDFVFSVVLGLSQLRREILGAPSKA